MDGGDPAATAVSLKTGPLPPTEAYVPAGSPPPLRTGGGPSPVPGYEILGELGRGGMGVVYRARHVALNRVVALKMILAGSLAGAQELARFRAEAEAVARLRHPHIVQVFDCGCFDDRPYLALEYCEGGSLAARLRGTPLPPAEAARLVGKLAEAMAAAHAEGIVHRDLKPANVLLQRSEVRSQKSEVRSQRSQDRDRELGAASSDLCLLTTDLCPKITDFGLAKRLDEDSGYTRTGAILGTPSYMAPEQAEGAAKHVGPAADVYALGAILYECLTGRPPFQGATVLDTLEQVRLQEPVPPRVLQPKTPRDLETICLKCLQKQAAQRYASAAALAEDLRRYQEGEPIRARPVGPAERAAKWARRHKGAVAALAAAGLVLAVLTVGSFVAAAYFRVLAAEREKARADAVQAGNRAEAARKEEARLAQDLRRNLYFAQTNLAGQAADSPGGIGQVAAFVDRWRHGQPDLRGWEWYYLDGLGHRDRLTLRGHRGVVYRVAWSPDGTRVASASADGTVKLWDPATGRDTRTLVGRGGDEMAVAWSPDGKRLAAGNLHGAVTLWDAASGRATATFGGKAPSVAVLAWSPDGKRLAVGNWDRTVTVWDPATGKATLTLPGHTLGAPATPAWSADSRLLATADWHNGVAVWDTDSGRQVRTLSARGNLVSSLAWGPDGRRLAGGSYETMLVWDAVTGKLTATFRGHTRGISALAWSRDSRRLASAGNDQTIKVWDPDTGTATATLRGHANFIGGLAWSPDGTRLASAGYDRTVKVWDAAASPEPLPLRSHRSLVSAVAWSPDGTRLASASHDGALKLWDLERARASATWYGHKSGLTAVAWSPDGSRLVTGSFDQTIQIWDAFSGRQLRTLHRYTTSVVALGWSPDGARLASAAVNDTTVTVWDPAAGKVVVSLKGHTNGITALAWGPDGTRLATASYDGTVRVWDVASGQTTLVLRNPATAQVMTVAWSPDGRRLASGANNDRAVRVWDAASGRELLTLTGHTNDLTSVAWSRDGTRLASASADGTVKVWDIEAGKEVLTLHGHTGQVTSVAWDPDDLRLAAAGEDHTILIYDATPGYTAERSPRLLPLLDRHLDSEPVRPEDLQVRAEVHARQGDWDRTAADARDYVALSPGRPRLFSVGWWIVGPYPTDLNESYAPENHPNPTQPVAGPSPADGEPTLLHWQTAPQDANGLVSFGDLLPGTAPFSAYALLRVYSPEEQPVVIHPGSSGPLRLWLNGRVIHEQEAQRPPAPDQGAVPATLDAGWNTLLARVVPGPDGALYLRVSPPPEGPALAAIRRSLAAGRWDEAGRQAADALVQRPDDAPTRALAERAWRGRADTNAWHGEWARVAADCDRLLTLQPGDDTVWLRAALVQAQLGHADEYRRLCRDILRRFGSSNDPAVAARAAVACLVLPGAVEDGGVPGELLDRSLTREPDNPLVQFARGLAEERAGRPADAARWCETSLRNRPPAYVQAATDFLLALTQQQRGQADAARSTLARARELTTRHLPTLESAGTGWPDWLMVDLLHRETLTLVAGPPDRAVARLEGLLRRQQADLGADHPTTLGTLHDLAGACYEERRWDRAAVLWRQALAKQTAKLGPDHSGTAATRHNLALAEQLVGHFKEAVPLWEQVLARQKAERGPDHPDTLLVLADLAESYRGSGKPDRAVPLYEQAVARMHARLGPGHLATLHGMTNLAWGYSETGRQGRAVSQLRETLKETVAALGRDHPRTLSCMVHLARAYHDAWQPERAVPLLEYALARQRALLAPDHPDVEDTMVLLARAYHACEELDRAVPLYEVLLAHKMKDPGPDNPDTRDVMSLLARAYQATGKLDRALALYEQVLPKQKATLGADNLVTLDTLARLADVYEEVGRYDREEPLRRELLDHERKSRAKPVRVASALALLGLNLLRQQKYAEAEPVVRECLAIRAKEESDYWTTFNTRSLLGGALLGEKNYAAAEPLLLEGYEGMKEREDLIPARARARLTETLERLVRLYEATGRKDKARAWRKKLDAATGP
jgi:WD40 repeat protein/tetratricopeptide (TPR) repeat protein